MYFVKLMSSTSTMYKEGPILIEYSDYHSNVAIASK